VTRALLQALDPASWALAAFGWRADPWQAVTMRSTAGLVVLCNGRQVGKTSVTALLALHHALHVRGALVVCIAPSLRQSAEWFRTTMGFVGRLAPRPVTTEESASAVTFASGSRVVALPASEATTRGFAGVTLLIEDEASRVPDEVSDAMRPALAVSGGRHCMLSTPNGQRGHFHAAWTSGEPAERIRVRSDECPRISPAWLASERLRVGERFYAQEFGAEFVDADGQLFSTDVIDRAFREDVRPLVLSLDVKESA
jgi:hypothetical protein